MSGRADHVVLGVLQLALLRAEGMRQFGDSRGCFLNSLAPLITLPLVGAVLAVASGAGPDDLAALLGSLIGLLAPPVLSEAMARLFGREREWLRYATAFNWSRWALLLAAGVALMLMATLAAAGLGDREAVALGLAAVLVYSIMLDWFIARVGLRLAWWQAALVVLVVNVGAALLFLVPRVLAGLQGGVMS